MEISVREMLRDVFPVNRRKLALDIVKHVEESRRTTMSFFSNKHDNRENTHLSGGKSMKMDKKCASKALKCMY